MKVLRFLTVLVLAALASSITFSLGIGPISNSSYLGEPLDAQAILSNTGELSIEEIRVRQAPDEIYEKMGIRKDHNYLPISYQIVESNGQFIIKISSKKPIKEPYVHLIVQVLWPKGEVNREYKVFIDPRL